jgi:hypothetical protein
MDQLVNINLNQLNTYILTKTIIDDGSINIPSDDPSYINPSNP